MLAMTYDEGEALSDFNIEWEFEHLRYFIEDIETHDKVYSTANIFHRIRLGIVLGEIDCHDVWFVWNGEKLSINQFGVPICWPDGFLDQAEFSEDILRAALAKRRELTSWSEGG